jgi:hypothetical protein
MDGKTLNIFSDFVILLINSQEVENVFIKTFRLLCFLLGVRVSNEKRYFQNPAIRYFQIFLYDNLKVYQ